MNIFKENKKHGLDEEICRLQEIMKSVDPKSNEYITIAKNLETLYSAKSKGREGTVKLDTIATGIFGLVGIILIIYGEETRIITSKALGFVLKGRV